MLFNNLRALNPIQISVRFAKRRPKNLGVNYEYSDTGLWRKEQGLPTNPNRYGPLTNLPDYSYLDGRPVPLGMNQKLRMEKQLEYAQRIVKLSAEMDFAREWYAEKQQFKVQEKQSIIDNKLKRKGKELLPKN